MLVGLVISRFIELLGLISGGLDECKGGENGAKRR